MSIVKRLKEDARIVKYTHKYTANLMTEAADTITAYAKALEDIREELLYTMDMCEPGNPKQNNFVGGLQIAVEILNKHDPSKADIET